MSYQTDSSALLSSLSRASLFPSPLIHESFNPSIQVSVSFNDKSVASGNLFRASECVAAPVIALTPESNVDSSTTYTLLLVDPDAPTPDEPKFAYWRHWVVSRIKASSLSPSKSDQTADAQILTEYLGPGPKDESKPHRYMFLVYREPQGMKSLTKEDVGGEEFVQRRSFKAKEWTEKHGLELVGLNWMLGVGDGWVASKDEL